MTIFRNYAPEQVVICPCCLDRAALMKLDRYQRPYVSCEGCGGKVFFTNAKRARSLYFLEQVATEKFIERMKQETADRSLISDFFNSYFPTQRPSKAKPMEGETLAQWGEDGNEPGQIKNAPHGIWVDSTGDIYMCEVPFVPNRLTKYERI